MLVWQETHNLAYWHAYSNVCRSVWLIKRAISLFYILVVVIVLLWKQLILGEVFLGGVISEGDMDKLFMQGRPTHREGVTGEIGKQYKLLSFHLRKTYYYSRT